MRLLRSLAQGPIFIPEVPGEHPEHGLQTRLGWENRRFSTKTEMIEDIDIATMEDYPVIGNCKWAFSLYQFW